MKKSFKTFAIVIGALSILSGLYTYFKTKSFSDAWASLFIGVALIGSVLIESKRKKE